MNVVIIDDEKIAIDVLCIMMERIKSFSIKIRGTFTNIEEAFLILKKQPVDIVFLDIEMIEMNGLQVARQLLERYPSMQIIFITAHPQFAVEAFDVEATDYLLKPVHEKRLIKALTKAEQKIEPQTKGMYAHTLGSFYLCNQQGEVVKWRTKKVRELFLYLWLHRQRPLANTVIIDLLWADTSLEKAMNYLYTAIYQLRKVFKDNGIEQSVTLMNNHYRLNVHIESDYEEFAALLGEQQLKESSIQKMLEMYEGEFLEGEEYEWVYLLQKKVKFQLLDVLESYVSLEQKGSTILKLNCLQKMLELDEYNEQYMYALLKFFIEQNYKQECIEHYRSIKEKLEVELGIIIPSKIKKLYYAYIGSNN